MTKFGFAVTVAGGLAAAALGLSAGAAATTTTPAATIAEFTSGIDHRWSIDDIHPRPDSPKVELTARHNY